MPYKIERVQALLLEEISIIILQRIKDPRVKNVTITEVKVAPDCMNATVYYSVLGTDEDRLHVKEGLLKATSFVRRELAQHIELRVVPAIRFVYDETIAHAAHIAELLNKAQIKKDADDTTETNN